MEAVVDSYPLSPMQEGMLFESLTADRQGVDVEQMLISLDEELDEPAFREAWNRVVRRHAVLRTSFRWQDTERPRQDVHAAVELPFVARDWRDRSPGEQQRLIVEHLFDDRQQGVALDVAPLMRVALIRLDRAKYRCLWTFHHAILDGRSYPVILQEVFATYEALRQGRELSLSEPPAYRTFIDWLDTLDADAADAYWREHLKGFERPSTPKVPLEGTRRDDARQAHAEQGIRLSADTTQALGAFAKRNEVTLNTVLQGAWAVLLSRWAGVDDVVFGATRACRHATVPGSLDMAGVFINTVPVRADAQPDQPLVPFLQALRKQHVDHRPYEHTSLIRIRSQSSVPAGTGLFETLIVFESYLLETRLQALDEAWSKRSVELYEQTSFPLTLAVNQDGGELLIKLEYDVATYGPDTVDRMVQQLGHILGQIGEAEPDTRLSDLELWPASQLKAREGWVGERVEPTDLRLVHERIRELAQRRGDAVALDQGARKLTYRELWDRVSLVAEHLREMDVGPEVIVGICVERSVDFVLGVLAVMEAGGTFLPLDPAHPEERLATILEDSGTSLVLTQQRVMGKLPPSDIPMLSLDLDWAQPHNVMAGAARLTDETAAYVIYTSGTTGKPKGVVVTHGSLANHVRSTIDIFGLKPQDRVLQFASPSFDVALEEIFPTLAAGATLVFRTAGMLASAQNFLREVESTSLTVLNLPTAFWHEMVGGLPDDGAWPTDVRLLVVGGERASASALEHWRRQGTNHITFINAYGPTETTITSTLYVNQAPDATKGEVEIPREEVPIGRPLPNLTHHVLDRYGRPVPIGVAGQLFIGGAGLARGYLGKPALTAERFIKGPDGERCYATGDLVRWRADGQLVFVGRIDDQVKVRGFRIELGGIETTLEALPEVEEAVVLPLGADALGAYLVLARGHELDVHHIKHELGQRLPPYMVPSAFMALDRLPITVAGKVDKAALPPLSPGSTGPAQQQERESTALETSLIEIWEDVLGTTGVSVFDSFFELGGHSLLAVQMFSEVETELGLEVDPSAFFAAPTIEELALDLSGGAGEQVLDTVSVDETPAATSGASPETTAPSSSSLGGRVVLLQEGNAPLPLFCICGIQLYQGLAQQLGREQTTFGVFVPFEAKLGQGGGDMRMPTVEELAALYVDAIRAQQPVGP